MREAYPASLIREAMKQPLVLPFMVEPGEWSGARIPVPLFDKKEAPIIQQKSRRIPGPKHTVYIVFDEASKIDEKIYKELESKMKLNSPEGEAYMQKQEDASKEPKEYEDYEINCPACESFDVENKGTTLRGTNYTCLECFEEFVK
jgi:hypothetical protein